MWGSVHNINIKYIEGEFEKMIVFDSNIKFIFELFFLTYLFSTLENKNF